LKLENVSRHFETKQLGVDALKEVDLEVRKEEFLCVVGPSGCGKSTLLNILAGLDRPTSGSMRVDRTSRDRMVIFQEPALFPWLTAIENVEFGLKMKGIERAKRKRMASEALELVFLHRFKDAYIRQLSGGMKQRVALARALVVDPDVLLMDEPFAALDAQTRDRLHEELQTIHERTKKTIVFVTHNVREAACLGDRIVLMGQGVIRKEYKVPLARPRHIEDHGVIDIAREVREALREEDPRGAIL
jgi:NitT/TauT family transport system ATP-binding protein